MTTDPTPVPPSPATKISPLQDVRRVLALYAEQPGDAQVWQQVLVARRACAEMIVSLPPGQKGGPIVESVFTLFRVFEESGVADQPVVAEDLALVQYYQKRSWPGLVASMILVPAWQWPDAPKLDGVAPWLWAEYTRYLFYTPKGFAACGQAVAYSAHYVRRLEELAGWGGKNRGSSAVRVALQIYAAGSNCIPLYFDNGSLRHHYELRGQILKIATGVGPQEELTPIPREGRRLRVGMINRHFGQQTETYTTLPTFEHLDPEQFEVSLFVNFVTNTPVEDYCRQRVADFRVLPKELDAQIEAIRACNLDIVVFGTNLTAVVHEVTRLALYRLAPLQVVNVSSCTTSGFAECDLYVSGELTETKEAAEQYTERLALIPGPAHAFQYQADNQEPTNTWTRAALGLPEDAVVFVTAANYFKIIPEMQRAWARLLASVPGSRLLVHPFNPNWSSTYPIKRFCAEFDRALAAEGVSNDRLVVSSVKFPSRTDVKELLRIGDIYLDTYPFAGVNSLVDPLELNMPCVAWEGNSFRARMGSALLRTLGLHELVATDEKSYHDLAVALALDAPRRTSLRGRIHAAMERGAIFLDTLAHSDAFGEVLISAYDELCAVGRDAFRSTRTPIMSPREATPANILSDGRQHLEIGLPAEAASCARRVLAGEPDSPEARHLLGRALVAQGQLERAVTYLLAAVQRAESNARLWYDLALVLRQTGRGPDAIQALETSLRIDGMNMDGWFTLIEIAEQLGQTDLVREVIQVVKQLAPEDPRVIYASAMAGIF